MSFWIQLIYFLKTYQFLKHFKPKDCLSKNVIFTDSDTLTNTIISAYKVLSKEICPQSKNPEHFLNEFDLSGFVSDSNDYNIKKYHF